MRIIYLSPIGQYNHHLFPTYQVTFGKHGHQQVYNPHEATHVFMELVSGQVSYNQDLLKIIKERNIPIICFDNREFGGMSELGFKWKPIDLPVDIYFVRTTIKGFDPKNVFPYDWAYFDGCDFPPVSKEELFNRDYDVCYIGVEAPTRTNVINALKKDGRLKVKYIFNDHLTRLTRGQWLIEYRQSKMAIECEGGGLTSEKFLQLFSIAPQLIVNNEMIRAFPFTDGINCLDISKEPTDQEIEKIVDIIADKDWLYELYMNGISHIKKYHSEEAVSNYILGILKQCGL